MSVTNLFRVERKGENLNISENVCIYQEIQQTPICEFVMCIPTSGETAEPKAKITFLLVKDNESDTEQ